jgi:hypothetical protein
MQLTGSSDGGTIQGIENLREEGRVIRRYRDEQETSKMN